jgi:hypothetical protein
MACWKVGRLIQCIGGCVTAPSALKRTESLHHCGSPPSQDSVPYSCAGVIASARCSDPSSALRHLLSLPPPQYSRE